MAYPADDVWRQNLHVACHAQCLQMLAVRLAPLVQGAYRYAGMDGQLMFCHCFHRCRFKFCFNTSRVLENTHGVLRKSHGVFSKSRAVCTAASYRDGCRAARREAVPARFVMRKNSVICRFLEIRAITIPLHPSLYTPSLFSIYIERGV